MRVRYWGTRGSIAKAGPSTTRYGGNTACVEVRSEAGTLIVLDCGTGAHDLGQALMASGERSLRGHILISHTHWDHIQGIPFFAPLFVPGCEWDIYAPRGLAGSLRETLAGQMQYTYFPITLEDLGASIRFHELVEGRFQVGDIAVRAQYLNHPALTLGYRLEADGVSVVYASDHEPHSRHLASGRGEVEGQDRRHAEFLAGADLVIHDAQYTADEYPAKIGWGHSTGEYAVEMCRLAGARRLALIHHDPLRDDGALDAFVERARACTREKGAALDVFAAAEGETTELSAAPAAAGPEPGEHEFSAVTPVSPALVEKSVLLATARAATAATIAEALRADEVRVTLAEDGPSALRAYEAERPSLVILDRHLPGMCALEVCGAIRGISPGGSEVPVIVVASQAEAAAGSDAGVTEWLEEPFSSVYARTRARAWLLRSTCRWMRAPFPDDEEARVAALRQLGILGTPREERFDRLTRLAAALFDVPIALVSLVERDRQWFKACHGVDATETSREVSFCAHAILRPEVLVVPDALLDPRFADNPLVTGEPRIRFYAGYPLVLPSGARTGTLCLVDKRPRQLGEAELRLLQDLGALVQQEIDASATRPPAAS